MPETRSQAPRIFISHSKDFEFVKRLSSDLSHILDNEAAVWYDEKGLHGGDEWWDKIVKEITARNTFIVILTPESMKSPWVRDEMQIAWSRKNLKSRNRIQYFIPLHLRECTSKVPAYLKITQWISFLPPETYYSAFNKLVTTLNIPRDARVNEILRQIEILNTDIGQLVAPQAKDRDEQLRVLGKYVVYYMSQSQWDQVLFCVEEALQLAPNSSDWLNLRQEVRLRVSKKEPLFPSQNTKSEYTFGDRWTASNTTGYQTTISSTIPPHSTQASFMSPQQATRPPRMNVSSSPPFRTDQYNAPPHKSKSKDTSSIRNERTTTADFSQSFRKHIRQSKTRTLGYYLDNFVGLIAKLLPPINKEGFRAICVVDVLLIPGLFGVWFSSWVVALVSFILSLLLLIISSVAQNRTLATVLLQGFSISWPLVGWFIGGKFAGLLNYALELAPNSPPPHVDARAIEIGALIVFLIVGICLHLVLVRATRFLVQRSNAAPASK